MTDPTPVREGDVQTGMRCRDTITGFEGIVVTIAEHIHGCRRVALRPQELNDEGEPIESQWFDEPRLEILDNGLMELAEAQNEAIPATGSAAGEPPKRQDSG